MHILGKLLKDNAPTRHALTSFFGIGPYTARRLCARLMIHDRCKIRDLTPVQITSLTAFLSSPTTAAPAPHFALASPRFIPSGYKAPVHTLPARSLKLGEKGESKDPLLSLKIETDLKREIRENIAHQRMIGSYVGRRHAMGLPVRGQNTQTNAKTARKLNRIERYL